jgi:hypothetical protein
LSCWISIGFDPFDAFSKEGDAAASGVGDIVFGNEVREEGRSSSGDVGLDSLLLILLMIASLSIEGCLLPPAGVLGLPV